MLTFFYSISILVVLELCVKFNSNVSFFISVLSTSDELPKQAEVFLFVFPECI